MLKTSLSVLRSNTSIYLSCSVLFKECPATLGFKILVNRTMFSLCLYMVIIIPLRNLHLCIMRRLLAHFMRAFPFSSYFRLEFSSTFLSFLKYVSYNHIDYFHWELTIVFEIVIMHFWLISRILLSDAVHFSALSLLSFLSNLMDIYA